MFDLSYLFPTFFLSFSSNTTSTTTTTAINGHSIYNFANFNSTASNGKMMNNGHAAHKSGEPAGAHKYGDGAVKTNSENGNQWKGGMN